MVKEWDNYTWIIEFDSRIKYYNLIWKVNGCQTKKNEGKRNKIISSCHSRLVNMKVPDEHLRTSPSISYK